MRRAIEVASLIVALAIVVAIGWTRQGSPPSTHSTLDAGPNGYEALYNVLRAEGVAVARYTDPLGLLPASVKVLAIASAAGDADAGTYGAPDRARLAAFVRRGGTIVAFTDGNDPLRKLYPKKAIRLDVKKFDNVALERHPAAALVAYAALAHRGPVLFDERVHGYASDRSMWSVLPPPVRFAGGLIALALVLALIGANVRWIPALAAEPPGDRDSSDYIASMAQLLRRAGAPHVSYERKDHS
ncbi:MAG TPA: DUF4350 domain-containing protein [Candidatus Baltobacteraceae bacterium]|nr:DUF4350 domain-containing protein [Candidatus Baltobacteraceae bacterium]